VKNILKEFKDFILRGNVIDLAVGIIIGVAFGAIVNSLVNDVIMPPVGRLFGKVDFSSLFINLTGTPYNSLADARQAGATVIAYGAFINTVINFVIIAFVLLLVIKAVNRVTRLAKPKSEAAPAPKTKECAFCCSTIPIKATRCPECTSQLAA
jgi:large conductance mechanosensitive channel